MLQRSVTDRSDTTTMSAKYYGHAPSGSMLTHANSFHLNSPRGALGINIITTHHTPNHSGYQNNHSGTGNAGSITPMTSTQSHGSTNGPAMAMQNNHSANPLFHPMHQYGHRIHKTPLKIRSKTYGTYVSHRTGNGPPSSQRPSANMLNPQNRNVQQHYIPQTPVSTTSTPGI